MYQHVQCTMLPNYIQPESFMLSGPESLIFAKHKRRHILSKKCIEQLKGNK